MQRTRLVITLWSLAVGSLAWGQVISPMEIKEPLARKLQQQYLSYLNAIAGELDTYHFPYPFYFSSKLDLEEEQEKHDDQRSIRFGSYDNQTVLQFTGNYFAAYSTELMDGNKRVRQTLLDVGLPILKTAVPHFLNNDDVQAYAVEISHHIRSKVMGVKAEQPENIVIVIPREAAEKLVSAKTTDQQQAAILESQVFLNAEPITLWMTDDPPPPQMERNAKKKFPAKASGTGSGGVTSGTQPNADEIETPSVSPALMKKAQPTLHATTPEALAALQLANQSTLDRMVRELDLQAHFVSYAQPTFIDFHHGAYLQISTVSTLDNFPGGSTYKQAALAFDSHISHLIRPMLAYFAENSGFEGLDFSTSVKLAGDAKGSSLAVEFILPFATLRCYEQYDCTGQKLINSGYVLINGERVSLDLQNAEK